MDQIVSGRLVGGFGRIKQVVSLRGNSWSPLINHPVYICEACTSTIETLICVMLAVQISAEEYTATSSDPVASFAEPIALHMNRDHADSIVAMVRHYVGIAVQTAIIISIDRSVLTILIQL
jgi:hypothetical protein